jgi:integrase
MDIAEVLENITAEEIEKFKVLAEVFGGRMLDVGNSKTLKQGIDEYEDHAKFNLEPKSVSLSQTANRQMLKLFPGNRSLNTIEKKDAENLFRHNSITAPRGAVNYNRCYKSMFNKFKEWRYYVKENPFNIKTPQRQKAEPVAIPSDEINMIYDKLMHKGKEVIADMVLFAVESGLRLAEEANLRWTDVDFKNKVITIGSKLFQCKTKRIRKIPYNSRMEEILLDCSSRQLKQSKIIREFVFTKPNGRPFMLDSISKAFKKVCRENGLPEEYHWHCLRSTAASNWVNRQVPIYTVSKLLGHSNVRTTQIYAKVDLEEMREAVNRASPQPSPKEREYGI